MRVFVYFELFGFLVNYIRGEAPIDRRPPRIVLVVLQAAFWVALYV